MGCVQKCKNEGHKVHSLITTSEAYQGCIVVCFLCIVFVNYYNSIIIIYYNRCIVIDVMSLLM